MKNRTQLVGVILAGGKGTRINNLPTNVPKPALPILNKPIIYYQLKTIYELGIKRVFIVVGHQSYHLVQSIEKVINFDLELKYVDQQQSLGIAHSVTKLESYINSPFLLFLGDIFFESTELSKMINLYNNKNIDGILAAKKEENVDLIKKNYCIITDKNDTVTKVVEKPKYPQSINKGVGIYLFDNSFFDAARRTPRTAIRDEYEITDSIQIYINDGYTVKISHCIKNDINITYPKDLWRINMQLLKNETGKKLIGHNVDMGDSVLIKKSIIGNNCKIGSKSQLVNCIVFNNVIIPEKTEISNSIICEGGNITIK